MRPTPFLGSRVCTTSFPCFSKNATSRSTCVVLPLPSIPSIAIYKPSEVFLLKSMSNEIWYFISPRVFCFLQERFETYIWHIFYLCREFLPVRIILQMSLHKFAFPQLT